MEDGSIYIVDDPQECSSVVTIDVPPDLAGKWFKIIDNYIALQDILKQRFAEAENDGEQA